MSCLLDIIFLKEWSEEMINKVEEILENMVRPQLATHYGNIELISVENGIVEVKLLGECSGCPSAKFTIEDVVETTLREALPGIKKVILKNEVSEELLDMAREILYGNKFKS